jgi:hypothetical protein
MPHNVGLGAIFGIVAENAQPIENARVRLFDRTNDRFLRAQLSAADGGFAFNGLDPTTDDYMVLVTDESGGTEQDPYKNALVQDRVRPVPVNVGVNYPSAWFSLARRLNPTLLYPAPHNNGTFWNLIPNYNDASAFKNGGLVESDIATPFTNGAQNLPVIKLKQDTWWRMRGGWANAVGDYVTTRFSMCCAPSFSTAWGITQRFSDRFYDNSSPYIAIIPLITIGFNGTNTIRIELYNTLNSSIFGDDWTTGNGAVIQSTYNVVLTQVPTGFEMVTIVHKGGESLKLYVGDTLYTVATSGVPNSFNTTNCAYRNHLHIEDAGFHAYGRAGPTSGGQMLAFYMFTHFLMTAKHVSDLKTALWSGTFPTETGYARSVTTDLPGLYYRLSDFSTDGVYTYDHYIGNAAEFSAAATYSSLYLRSLRYNTGQTHTTTTSPIIGMSATYFNGAKVLYHYDGAALGAANFTLEWWMKRDAITTEAVIARLQTRHDNTAVRSWSVHVLTDGTLRLALQSATLESLTSTYAAPIGEWVHVVWVVDKYNTNVKLYINGVVSQTFAVTNSWLNSDFLTAGNSSVSGTRLYGTYTPEDFPRPLVIGGLYSNGTLSNTYKGSLAEFAGYGYPLPAYRILEHYNNKDVI